MYVCMYVYRHASPLFPLTLPTYLPAYLPTYLRYSSSRPWYTTSSGSVSVEGELPRYLHPLWPLHHPIIHTIHTYIHTYITIDTYRQIIHTYIHTSIHTYKSIHPSIRTYIHTHIHNRKTITYCCLRQPTYLPTYLPTCSPPPTFLFLTCPLPGITTSVPAKVPVFKPCPGPPLFPFPPPPPGGKAPQPGCVCMYVGRVGRYACMYVCIQIKQKEGKKGRNVWPNRPCIYLPTLPTSPGPGPIIIPPPPPIIIPG